MDTTKNNKNEEKVCGCCRIIGNCRICALIIAIICFLIGFAVLFSPRIHWGGKAVPVAATYKSASYQVEGASVVLMGGVATSTSSETSVVTTTRYFGNEALGDLNGDGKTDVSFLISQNTGGSGTFYYVVASLKTDEGYTGTNAVFLGDRIAPQSSSIKAGTIIVNYGDRNPGESMTTKPSLGISRYFTVKDGKLVEMAAK